MIFFGKNGKLMNVLNSNVKITIFCYNNNR